MKSGAFLRNLFTVVILLCTLLLAGFTNEPPANDQRVAVLTFHSVSPEFMVNPLAISRSELDLTFKMMKEHGYNPISLNKFHNFIEGRESVPDKAVLITFDDGYENNYLLGYQVAKQYNVPAVIFAVTQWFSDYPPETRMPHITRSQAKKMLSDGLWTIAGHSFDGHRMVQGAAGPGAFFTTRIKRDGNTETQEAYRVRLAADNALSTVTLNEIGIEPVDFAFPFGIYNDEAKEMLAKSGYRYLYTTEPGLNRPGQDPHHIYRIPATKWGFRNIALLDYYFSKEL